MEAGSPVSLDLNLYYSKVVPGIDENKVQTNSDRTDHREATRSPTSVDVRAPNRIQTQHRASIDSVFEREIAGQWSPQDASHRSGEPTSVSNRSQNDEAHEQNAAEDDQTPTWSELKTKAGKERKRLPLACIACRRKKIKCSGEKPACRHCLRARVPCVYKVTARKAAPRTDYMAMLDKRLKRMEDRVIKMIPKEDLPDLNVTGRSSVRPPLPGQVPKKEKVPGNKRNAEEAFDAELNDWTRSRQQLKSEGSAPIRNQREADNKLSVEGSDALPPTHIQEHLAELFFDCVYGQSYLLLHKPSFMRKLKAGTVPPVLVLAVCAISARFSTHPQVSSEPAFLRGEQWATPARNIIEKRHFEPNVTILTSMVILGLHYFGTCEGGLSWSFGGQAMRLGYALQLHRELDHDPLGRAQAESAAASGNATPTLPELSFTDREIRRRLMWACYLMDTFNSSGTERPSFLNEEYMKIQLPIKESQFHLEIAGLTEDLEGHVTLPSGSTTSLEQAQNEARSNMGVAAYIIRAVVIWKKIVQYLNLGGKDKDSHQIWDPLSQFAVLQRQIIQLRSSLPESLKYTPENLSTHVSERLANQFLFLHIILAQNNLFLHRFAIPTAPNVHRPYPSNTPKAFLAKCATTVVESANLVSAIIADSTGHTFTVPFAGYCAYAAATVHVWGIFSKHRALEVSSKENLRHNYRYLTRMKRYWGIFHYMAESIKDVYRAFADAAAKSSSSHQLLPTKANDGLESLADAISADQSRVPSPAPGSSENHHARNQNSLSPKTDKAAGTAGNPMLQYGDWFDKYPHGVSESEWESSHLPHRKEAQKGHEAIMSQQSDLQSVEEFFANLSPPSRADRHDSGLGQRSKKVARRKTKSVVGNTSTNTVGADKIDQGMTTTQKTARSQSQNQHQFQTQQHRHSSASTSNRNIPLDLNTSDIDIPMSEYTPNTQRPLQSQPGTSFDMPSTTSDFYQTPQYSNLGSGVQHAPLDFGYHINSPSTASNPGTVASHNTNNGPTSSANQLNFNFSYTSALPHLDRQMVFGAYAGIDPSTTNNSSALNNPNNLDFWSNPWDMNVLNTSGSGQQIGMDDFDYGIPVNSGGNGGAHVGSMGGNGSTSRQGNSSGGMGSAAWFMPFNIEPPSFGGLEGFGTIDGMDIGTESIGGESFSNQGGGGGGGGGAST